MFATDFTIKFTIELMRSFIAGYHIFSQDFNNGVPHSRLLAHLASLPYTRAETSFREIKVPCKSLLPRPPYEMAGMGCHSLEERSLYRIAKKGLRLTNVVLPWSWMQCLAWGKTKFQVFLAELDFMSYFFPFRQTCCTFSAFCYVAVRHSQPLCI